MKTFITPALLLLFSLFTNHTLAQADFSQSYPGYNILWIVAEDLSPRLAAYGDSTAHTPNLNRLAREGVTYQRAFATYGVCAPARHSLIMGMYPTSTGAGAMRTWKRTSAIKDITDPDLLNIPVYEATPPVGAKCFTEYLRAVGYYCTNNAKSDYQFQPPITAWDENNNKAHWRNRPDPEMPFFSVFNFGVTHESQIHSPPSPEVTNPDAIEVPPYYPNTLTVRKDIAHHYDNVVTLDQQIEKVLNQLKEDGLYEKTIIFFYGDHGDGLPRAKRWVYDSGIKVPLIIRFPEQAHAGTNEESLVSFVDFAPTILSLLNIAIPAHMEGQAFLGEAVTPTRKYIYASRDRMDPAYETIRAVRDTRYKYIRNYRPDLPYIGFIPYRDRMLMMQEINQLAAANKLGTDQWQFWAQNKPLEELYDTQNDPHEIHNIASDPRHFEKLQKLREAHQIWTKTYGDLCRLPESELVRSLWPPDGVQPVTATPSLRKKGEQIEIRCLSPGASIAYRLDGAGRWLLYSGPITVDQGTLVESQAIRLGWKKSTVVEQLF